MAIRSATVVLPRREVPTCVATAAVSATYMMMRAMLVVVADRSTDHANEINSHAAKAQSAITHTSARRPATKGRRAQDTTTTRRSAIAVPGRRVLATVINGQCGDDGGRREPSTSGTVVFRPEVVPSDRVGLRACLTAPLSDRRARTS